MTLFACISALLIHQMGAAIPPPTCTTQVEPGSEFIEPPHYYSTNGVLNVTLNYFSFRDIQGFPAYCYISTNGDRSPTLHLNPGDKLLLTLNNLVTPIVGKDTSTNLHFHGLFVSPSSAGDNVVNVKLEAGDSFTFEVQIPNNHPSGLYWYHPHVYKISDEAVLGGASGAIIIEGIEKDLPKLSGMPYQTIVIRGTSVNENTTHPSVPKPMWDLSVGFAPITYPINMPVKMTVDGTNPQQRLWRVINANSDNILNIELQYDGVSQPLKIAAIDGSVSSDQTMATVRSYKLGPSSRVEFLFTTPSASVQNAALFALEEDTGPDGDPVPTRPLIRFNIVASSQEVSSQGTARLMFVPVLPMNFIRSAEARKSMLLNAGYLATGTAAMVHRTIVLTEDVPDDPNVEPQFYITVEGDEPEEFEVGEGPNIITYAGSVELWTIVNKARESHTFHIHQLHFKVLDTFHVPDVQHNYVYDNIVIPYGNETTGIFPSVTVLMNFHDVHLGYFMYHCHILEHEDNGMMAMIKVKPPRPVKEEGLTVDEKTGIVFGVVIGTLLLFCVFCRAIVLIRRRTFANRMRGATAEARDATGANTGEATGASLSLV